MKFVKERITKYFLKLDQNQTKQVSLLLVLFGSMLVSFASGRLIISYINTRQSNDPSALGIFYEKSNVRSELKGNDKRTIVREETDEPSEIKPDLETIEYKVPPNLPRRLIIPSLDINGLIQEVGITDNKQVAVPNNIHFGGWLVDSQIPGKQGLSIIDGHVGGVYSPGIFNQLAQAVPGTKFEIEFGDYSKKQFSIIEIKQLPEADSANFLFKKNPDVDKQLNLITCGGDYDKNTKTFVDRVVVVAEAV